MHYYLWQLAAYFVGRALHRKFRFDLIHHVTFVKYCVPSFLAMLPVPFIWGPVGGGESAPSAFWWSFSLRGKVFEVARYVARKVGEYDPFVRRTARRAVIGLATTEETAKQMRMLGCKQVFLLSAVGLSREEIQGLSSIPVRHEDPFRLISIGRLLDWKGFELGLRAFAKVQHQFPDSEYWVIGEGPERRRLETIAYRNGDRRQSEVLWRNPEGKRLGKAR